MDTNRVTVRVRIGEFECVGLVLLGLGLDFRFRGIVNVFGERIP